MVALSAALALLFLPTPPQSSTEEGPRTVRRGPHYEVTVHFDDAAAAELALATVESAWPRALALLGVEPFEPEEPLRVNLYPNKDAYGRVEEQLTGGAFRDTESFSHWNSRTAHVAMAPPLPPAAAAEARLSSQTREVLAHEAAHLAVYSVIPTYRWHPTWFAEGLAMAVELQVARDLGLIVDTNRHPRSSTYLVHAQRVLAENRLPTIDQLLRDTVDSLRLPERYAIWFELFRVLREEPERFARLVAEMRHMGGGPNMRRDVADFVREEYGEQRILARLRANVEALDPEWEELVRSLETMGDEWLHTAFPSDNAVAWRTHRVDATRYSLRGSVVFLGGRPQMNVLLDRATDGFVTVALGGDGFVTLFQYDANNAVWNTLARVEVRSLCIGERIYFDVHVHDGTVAVWIDGERRIEPTVVPGRTLDGPWGLGVQRGGAGIWRGVRVALEGEPASLPELSGR